MRHNDQNAKSRREFLEFMGMTSLSAASFAAFPQQLWAKGQAAKMPRIQALAPSTADELRLSQGFAFDVICHFGDRINARGDTFGYDNDFTAFMPLSDDEALLFVNHESVDPVIVSGFVTGSKRTRVQVEIERKAVGASILKLKRGSGGWAMVQDDPLNRRLTAETKIPFVADEAICGKTEAVGTLGNCSGGKTPWKTFLTCEENYQDFYGEIDFAALKLGSRTKSDPGEIGWAEFFDLPPEHYGWVVEVEPQTGTAKKLTALGRFAHEGVKVVAGKEGRAVAYMGDDSNDQCIYKFIADKAGSLEQGMLYVADVVNGKWLPLDHANDPRLKAAFKTKTEMLTWTREAAKIVGGTPMDRPEGIDIQPGTGAIFISLTNNFKKKNMYGSIFRIEEDGNDPEALKFSSGTLVAGGPESGFACPDNIIFDAQGNLWMVTDVSEKNMNKDEFVRFGNNSLFFIPMRGEGAGQPIRVATAPVDAEFTGPCFAPDGKTLFVCVQHPGKRTKDLAYATSRWGDNGKGAPRAAVVALRGSVLEQLSRLS